MFLFLNLFIDRKEKIAVMDRKTAFSLILDSADSTESDNSAGTDKLDSDGDEAVDFSKYPPM